MEVINIKLCRYKIFLFKRKIVVIKKQIKHKHLIKDKRFFLLKKHSMTDKAFYTVFNNKKHNVVKPEIKYKDKHMVRPVYQGELWLKQIEPDYKQDCVGCEYHKDLDNHCKKLYKTKTLRYSLKGKEHLTVEDFKWKLYKDRWCMANKVKIKQWVGYFYTVKENNKIKYYDYFTDKEINDVTKVWNKSLTNFNEVYVKLKQKITSDYFYDLKCWTDHDVNIYYGKLVYGFGRRKWGNVLNSSDRSESKRVTSGRKERNGKLRRAFREFKHMIKDENLRSILNDSVNYEEDVEHLKYFI